MDGNSAGPSTSAEAANPTEGSKLSSSVSVASGCGCGSHSTGPTLITINVTPTTGGQFDLQVSKAENVESLKKIISKRLKVPKERICLLHRERQLRDGTLESNHVMDGSRLTLLPSVESGLLAQRPEQSVMQALESLNDSQVNDFLSGKAPLNLTMRLGDHMMLIQLQLSTVSPSGRHRSTASSCSSGNSSNGGGGSGGGSSPLTVGAPGGSSTASGSLHRSWPQKTCKKNSTVVMPNVEFIPTPPASLTAITTAPSPSPSSSPSPSPSPNSSAPADSDAEMDTDPLSTLFTSSSKSFSFSGSSASSASHSVNSASASEAPYPAACEALLSQLMDSATAAAAAAAAAAASAAHQQDSSSPVCLNARTRRSECSEAPVMSATYASAASAALKSPPGSASQGSVPAAAAAAAGCSCDAAGPCLRVRQPTLDTRALAEASRNLTQTLKQLSSEVLTTRSDVAEDTSGPRRRQGAIIESMHHHGKGVYSGTFSGTLNPALQDRFGRPKRDISTIIHILNDLLCATPQYRRHSRSGQPTNVTVDTNPSGSSASSSPSPATVSGSTASSCLATGSSSKHSSVDVMAAAKAAAATATAAAAALVMAEGKLPVGASPDGDSSSSGMGGMDDDGDKEPLENQATRGKMERLRLLMKERRERRRALREARQAPYTSPPQRWSAKSETQPTNAGAGDAMDTDQPLCELTPPEPVVA